MVESVKLGGMPKLPRAAIRSGPPPLPVRPAEGGTSDVAVLRQRVDELETLLAQQRREAEQAQSRLLEEQDRFLADMIEEYQAEVQKAARERDAALAAARGLRAELAEATRMIELTRLQKQLNPRTDRSRAPGAAVDQSGSLDEGWDLAPSSAPPLGPPSSAETAPPAAHEGSVRARSGTRPAVKSAPPPAGSPQQAESQSAPAAAGLGVECELADGTRTAGVLEEVSLTGAFIRIDVPVGSGEQLTVGVALPGFGPVRRLRAIVRWSGPEGAGLEWKRLGAGETLGLMRLISRRGRRADPPSRLASDG
jgi:hypothetical protein